MNIQTQMLDFIDSNIKAGFRLHQFEVLNWGTFSQMIWQILPQGDNTLLTGDIGSGKSTLVDAITTLLVPHHRIVYNRAAGAENKERTLYSYIRGEFKNTKDQDSLAAKAVYLRDENNFTVLLGHFYNEGYNLSVTLAQVFWLKNNERNPERFFVVAQDDLNIKKHFSDFGQDIHSLKKRLKRLPATEVYDNFKEYAHRFRQLFGIQTEQALDLFYQTVSMKSVGNLTDFVRQQMLEKTDVLTNIETLKQNFENLNKAHEAILKVRKQIECLTPLIEDINAYEEQNQHAETLRHIRDLLAAYFAKEKILLLDERAKSLQLEREKNQQKLTLCRAELIELQAKSAQLKEDIDQQGGRRLQTISQEIQQLEQVKNKLWQNAEEYKSFCQTLALAFPENENTFVETQSRVSALRAECEKELQEIQIQQLETKIQMQKLDEMIKQMDQELTSLKSRKSNIPAKVIAIRDAMLTALKLDESRLPFVGELLQIKQEESQWEGTIERVLHNFGLSLLVPDEYYEIISRYVDNTSLRGKLVYYRVKRIEKILAVDKEKNLLIEKIQVKPDSEFYPWLMQELKTRFDYLCCEEIQDFRRAVKAITKNGQIKSPGERHEKDDRYDLFDRMRYILGWNNQQKILILEQKKKSCQNDGDHLVAKIQQLDQLQRQHVNKRDACRDLLRIQDFAEIHWQATAKNIRSLLEEKEQIEKSSNILKTLQTQLNEVQILIGEKDNKKDELIANLGKIEEQCNQNENEKNEAQRIFSEVQQAWFLKNVEALQRYRHEALMDKVIRLNNIDHCQSNMRGYIQGKIDAVDKKRQRLTENIIGRMQAYKKDFPAETAETDANLDAGKDYQRMLATLQAEDLPRHESRFKELLNESTINGIALLQNQLNKEKQEIEEKINRINQSLHDIEYNPHLGTYIKLVADQSQDVEIREFQQSLRQCLSHTVSSSNLYDEEKFLQVKAIISRFNGRKDQIETDRRWTLKVTDVRNWFSFSASECFFHDNTQHEFYSDSSGKSGGQKEKLAYTILASALAYQFGLEWGMKKSRSFRFVVIDEAFGRGSDESTRYGMELFKKLNLQLMIVTPLQKINIIENYVNTVHYVHNYEGQKSVVRYLTIEEYQKDKSLFSESYS